MGFPGGSDSKESACNVRVLISVPGFGKIPWRREWLPTPVFLPGEFHERRSLAGYSPWGCKELDMTDGIDHYLYARFIAPLTILDYFVLIIAHYGFLFNKAIV